MSGGDLSKWITSSIDFYDLLGLQYESFTAAELRRAYRKTALKYHPDKVGSAFDPAKYEQFQAAHDVLGDPALKEKYDNARNARLQKRRADALFEGRRRQMKEDLEAREQAGTPFGTKRPRDESGQQDAELRRLAEEGRKRRAMRAEMLSQELRSSAASSLAAGDKPRPPSDKQAESSRPVEGDQSSVKAQSDTQQQDEEISRLEEKLREAIAAKAKRKAEKQARKSGAFETAAPSPVGLSKHTENGGHDTPRRPEAVRSDIPPGRNTKEPSASTTNATSHTPRTPASTDFSATMARLRAAQRQREGLAATNPAAAATPSRSD